MNLKKNKIINPKTETLNIQDLKFKEKITAFNMPEFLKEVTDWKPISFLITPDIYIYIHKMLSTIFINYVKLFREKNDTSTDISTVSKIDYINIFFLNYMVTINITQEFNTNFLGFLDKKHERYEELINIAVRKLFTIPIVSLFSMGSPSIFNHPQILQNLNNSSLKNYEFLRNPYIKSWYTTNALANPPLLLNLFNSYNINEKNYSPSLLNTTDTTIENPSYEFCPNFYNIFINIAPAHIFPYITTQIDFWTSIFMYKTGYLNNHLDDYRAEGENYNIPKSPRNYIFSTFLYSQEYINAKRNDAPFQESGSIEKAIIALDKKVTFNKMEIDDNDKSQTFIHKYENVEMQKHSNLEKYFPDMRNTTDYLSLVHHALDEKIWNPKDKDTSLTDFSSIIKIDTSAISKEIAGFNLLKNEFNRRKKYCNNLNIQLSYSVFLVGPTGVGKTEIAKWIAASEERDLYLFNIGSIQNMYVGETERRMDEVIEKLKELKNSVILLDEIEKEITASNDANGTFSRLANRLMKFIESNDNQIIIATANNAKVIRPELMRRFDNSFQVGYPTKEQLKNIITIINDKKFKSKIFSNSALEEIVTSLLSKGKYSPDDITHICNNAHIEEIINEKKITLEEFIHMAINYNTIYSREKDKIEALQPFYKDYPDVNQEEKKYTIKNFKKNGI